MNLCFLNEAIKIKLFVSKKEKVAAIVNTAGARYADVSRSETKTIEAKGENMTAEDLIKAMSEMFCIS